MPDAFEIHLELLQLGQKPKNFQEFLIKARPEVRVLVEAKARSLDLQYDGYWPVWTILTRGDRSIKFDQSHHYSPGGGISAISGTFIQRRLGRILQILRQGFFRSLYVCLNRKEIRFESKIRIITKEWMF